MSPAANPRVSQQNPERENGRDEFVEKVRENVDELLVKRIPETEKPLRLSEQSFWLGKLTYSAARAVKDGAVSVRLKVMLPPDAEDTFDIVLSPAELESVEMMKEIFRKTVVERYVFKNKEKKDGMERKGITMEDMPRFDEMAKDIRDTFKENQL